MFFAIKRRWTAASPDNLPRTFKRMADAQRMLRDLLPLSPSPKKEKEMSRMKKNRSSRTSKLLSHSAVV